MTKRLSELWYRIFPPPVPPGWEATLRNHSDYFRRLSKADKQKFLQRLAILLKFKKFIPKGLPEVSSEMKIVIGSAIIQMTFGFSKFLFKHFTTIYVMPCEYQFRGREEPFLGHVDFQAKVICFSWEDVKKGYAIADDAFNLALHEIAHAWEMEHRLSDDFEDIFIEKDWKDWHLEAYKTREDIIAGRHRFLRKYGAENQKEMFAVCVEAFFEQPAEFVKELPVLYEKMVKLLRQNPLENQNEKRVIPS